jgi:hypothetical protein
MRNPRRLGSLFLLLIGSGFLTWSLFAQERPVSYSVPAAPGTQAMPLPVRATTMPSQDPGIAHPARDVTKLPLLQQQMYRTAMGGADWLFRANGSDGHFTHGFVPALKTTLEGDHYLRQAGAAFALARAARFCGDARYAARAKQAILLLLADTATDPNNPTQRTTTFPPVMVNHLGAAGMLLMAIHELPAPAEDLLQQSDQLCNYIRSRQQADGSLAFVEAPADVKGGVSEVDGLGSYPGAALYGLMLSQRQRPMAWKTETVKKALAYYAPWWRANKNIAFVPWQTAAYTEAFLRTKDPAFVEFVNEMADWVCELQHPALDPRHPQWGGGFMDWTDGKPVTSTPQVGSAALAEALAESCRLARASGDLAHYQRYREALERCLQFLTRLQYTEASTQHFADWYRRDLIGAFHASFQDGNIRIDYAQHSVCALVQYLLEVVE